MTDDFLRLPAPIKGLNVTESFEEQPPLTTREAKNVRPYDPVSGRKRIGQRAGTSEYAGGDQVNGDARVDAILGVTRHKKHVDFAVVGSPGDGTSGTTDDIEYQLATPTERSSLNGTTDRQGNLYLLDGPSGVTKYNAEGEEIWKLSVPVKNDGHVIRAIAVDEVDRLFVAVSSGAQDNEAGIWYFRQTVDEEEPEEVWFFQTDRFVQEIVVSGGRLYSIEDDHNDWTSILRVLSGIETPTPIEDWQRPIPYPSNGLDVASNGAIFTAHEPFEDRGKNPNYPQFSPAAEGFKLENLLNYQERVWCDFRADDASSLLVASGLAPEDGDEILRWDDSRGSIRYFEPETANGVPGGAGAAHTGPTYVSEGINGRPTLRFNGSTSGMVSGTPQNTDRESSDQHGNALPSYTDSKYAMFLLLRIPETTSTPQPVIMHPGTHPNVSSGDDDQIRALVLNRDEGQDFGGPALEGNVQWYERAVSTGPEPLANEGHATQNFPLTGNRYDFDGTRVVLVTVVVNGYDQTSNINQRQSVFRVNGQPIDIWDAHSNVGVEPVYLGTDATLEGLNNLGQFDIARMLVLRDYGGVSRVIQGPNYPRLESDQSATTELEQVEAMIAWEYGVSNILEDREALSFDNATPLAYTHAGGTPRILVRAGAFTDYTYDPADRIWITAATGGIVTGRPYEVEARIDDDTIQLKDDGLNELSADATGVEGYMIWPHIFRSENGPPPSSDVFTQPEQNTGILISPNGILAKWRPEKGAFAWAMSTYTINPPYTASPTTTSYGGVGYGVRCNSDDNVYSIGPAEANDSNNALRLVVDEGDGFSIAGGDGAWQTAIGAGSGDWDYNYPRMSVDEADEETGYEGDRLYVPWSDSTGSYGAAGPPIIGIFTKNGSNISNVFLPGATTPTCQAALFDASIPDIESDFSPAAWRAEFVYALLDPVGNAKFAIYKFKTLTRTANQDGPRELTRLVAAGGNIAKFTSSAVSSVTGGTGALASGASAVFAVAWRERGYFLDGVSRVKVYDPREDEVTTLASKTSGKLPLGARIMELWRDRLFLGHFADAPADWAMSEQGNPKGWNLFPPVINFRQAVRGIVSEAGEAPGLINGFVPVTDDVALFLLDRQIWQLSGDPAQGGQFDLLLDEVGGAFGRAWCKDPNGVVYFMSTEGTIYRFAGGVPQPLTRFSIDPLLMEIRMDQLRMELAWNEEDKTVHVFQIPYDPDAADVQRSEYVFDVRTDSWWEDTRSAATQVTAVERIRADDYRDRVLVLGGADGRLRRWDKDARDDADSGIATSLIYGPYSPPNEDEITWTEARVLLAENQNGCRVEAYASDNPDVMGEPLVECELEAGRNHVSLGVTGAYLWLRFFAAQADHRWAIERVSVETAGMGQQKGR